MLEKRNDCVGCDLCLHCGLNHTYYEHYCDRCEDFLGDSNYRGYTWEGQELCQSCLRYAMVEKHFFKNGVADKAKICEFFLDEEWLKECDEFEPVMFEDVDVDDIAEFCGEDYGFLEEEREHWIL